MAGCSGTNVKVPNVQIKNPGCKPAVTEFVPARELLRILECPICMEVPLSPIRMYQCQNGHNVCGNCKVKLVNCATCKGKINETRNYAIESVIGESKFNCPHDGCDEIVKGAQQEAHRSKCKFGPVPCTICGEGKRIPLQKYLLHMKEAHEVNQETEETVDGNNITMELRLSNTRPIILGNESRASHSIYDKHDFICTVRPDNGDLYCWVALIGEEEEAKKYKAKVICQHPTNSDTKIEWAFPVHGIRKQWMDIHHSGQCAILSVSKVEPFIDKPEGSHSLTLDVIWEKVTKVHKRTHTDF